MSIAHELDECGCCGYKTELKEYPGVSTIDDPFRQNTKIKLCNICASTFLSSCITYPRLYDSNQRDICSSLGWIANYLADLIKELGDKK